MLDKSPERFWWQNKRSEEWTTTFVLCADTHTYIQKYKDYKAKQNTLTQFLFYLFAQKHPYIVGIPREIDQLLLKSLVLSAMQTCKSTILEFI